MVGLKEGIAVGLTINGYTGTKGINNQPPLEINQNGEYEIDGAKALIVKCPKVNIPDYKLIKGLSVPIIAPAGGKACFMEIIESSENSYQFLFGIELGPNGDGKYYPENDEVLNVFGLPENYDLPLGVKLPDMSRSNIIYMNPDNRRASSLPLNVFTNEKGEIMEYKEIYKNCTLSIKPYYIKEIRGFKFYCVKAEKGWTEAKSKDSWEFQCYKRSFGDLDKVPELDEWKGLPLVNNFGKELTYVL